MVSKEFNSISKSKIVVRAPNWLGDIVMSLPFFKRLNDLASINNFTVFIIIKPEFKSVIELAFNNIKSNFKFILFTKSNGIFNFKKNNPELYNCEYYFTLTPSFSSAFMGKVLNARRRIGYRSEFRSFLFSDAFTRPTNIHRANEYIELLNYIFSQNDNQINSNDIPVITLIKSKFIQDLDNYIVVNANSEASSRRLPNEKWAEIFKFIKNKKIVFVGVKKDFDNVSSLINHLSENCIASQNEYINLVGQTDISDLFSVIFFARLVISNDSGPAHITSLLKRPLVVFFGAGDEKNTAPIFNKEYTFVINEKINCSPCLKNICPIGTLDCLHKVDARKVFDKIYNLI